MMCGSRFDDHLVEYADDTLAIHAGQRNQRRVSLAATMPACPHTKHLDSASKTGSVAQRVVQPSRSCPTRNRYIQGIDVIAYRRHTQLALQGSGRFLKPLNPRLLSRLNTPVMICRILGHAPPSPLNHRAIAVFAAPFRARQIILKMWARTGRVLAILAGNAETARLGSNRARDLSSGSHLDIAPITSGNSKHADTARSSDHLWEDTAVPVGNRL